MFGLLLAALALASPGVPVLGRFGSDPASAPASRFGRASVPVPAVPRSVSELEESESESEEEDPLVSAGSEPHCARALVESPDREDALEVPSGVEEDPEELLFPLVESVGAAGGQIMSGAPGSKDTLAWEAGGSW